MDEGKIFPKGGNILPKSTPHDGGESQPKIFLGGDILDSSPPCAHVCLHCNVWKSTVKRYHDFYGKINIFSSNQRFPKEVTIELISRNFFSVIAFFSTFPHCALCAAGAVFKFWSDKNSVKI